MSDYIEREVPWDDQYISKTDAIKLAAIIVVPFATSENIQDIHKAFERTIDKYPAADVQPVKHGYWKYETDYCIVCSECGNPAEINCITGDFMESPYCNGCGAKMDGKSETTYHPPINWCGEEPIGENSDG